MFFITYLWRELRRRMRQAVFIALGLAVGIGLVITVTAASSGLKNAQGTVLHSLYGVGTAITGFRHVTAAAGALSASNLSVSGSIPTGGGGLGSGSGSGTSIKTSTFG